MKNIIDTNISDFLVELTTLTNKYKIKIDSCGGCEYAWVEQIKAIGKYEYNSKINSILFIEKKIKEIK